MTYDGQELYPALYEKTAALAYSLARNHAFVDGNKRISHAAMELLLRMNGVKITGSADEQERVFLALASSQMQRDEFTEWVRNHIQPL